MKTQTTKCYVLDATSEKIVDSAPSWMAAAKLADRHFMLTGNVHRVVTTSEADRKYMGQITAFDAVGS